MESWIVSSVLAVGTFIGIYAVTKYKVDVNKEELEVFKRAHKDSLNELRKDIKEHNKINVSNHSDIAKRINASFKRIDEVSHDITVLQGETANHLDMPQAEKKFVPRDELVLHLQNVTTKLWQMEKNDEVIMGKLEDLTKSFSHYMLGTINKKDE